MFNHQKQNNNMKKYNAPVARFINLASEGSLMVDSYKGEEGNGTANSNERSAFSSIWDTEE